MNKLILVVLFSLLFVGSAAMFAMFPASAFNGLTRAVVAGAMCFSLVGLGAPIVRRRPIGW